LSFKAPVTISAALAEYLLTSTTTGSFKFMKRLASALRARSLPLRSRV
jgi:hypothetical protein